MSKHLFAQSLGPESREELFIWKLSGGLHTFLEETFEGLRTMLGTYDKRYARRLYRLYCLAPELFKIEIHTESKIFFTGAIEITVEGFYVRKEYHGSQTINHLLVAFKDYIFDNHRNFYLNIDWHKLEMNLHWYSDIK